MEEKVVNNLKNRVDVNTPASVIVDALASIDAKCEKLFTGITVLKVTTRGSMKSRVLTISEDKFALLITHHSISRGLASFAFSKVPTKHIHDGSNRPTTGVPSNVANLLPVPYVSRKGIYGLTRNLKEEYIRYIDIADINYISTGVVGTRQLEECRTLNRLLGKDSPIDEVAQNVVTIGHHGDKALDIIISDKGIRTAFVDCIRKMQQTYMECRKLVSHESLLLRYIWYHVDTNSDGFISSVEFENICHMINLPLENPHAVYLQFCKDKKCKDAKLRLPSVMALLHTLRNNAGSIDKVSTSQSKSMASILWDRLFGTNIDVIDANVFLSKFLHLKQKEIKLTIEDSIKLIQQVNSIEINHNEGENNLIDTQLSRTRFETFLYHELNDAYNPIAIETNQTTLNEPMSKYFINSSHNTYLTGDQLKSSSSVEMYGKALRRGCKCVELDCWDGEEVSSVEMNSVVFLPVVYHGHTLTSKILFQDVIRIVKCYLDEFPDTYPIILSIENHCSIPFQITMAKLLHDTFGEKLHIPSDLSSQMQLPSPEELRGKVVIKGKRPPGTSDEKNDDDSSESGTENTNSVKINKNQTQQKQSVAKEHKKLANELASLTLFHGTKFKNFEKSMAEPPSHMHSIGETKITKILDDKSQARSHWLWRKYNEFHMTRTYPAGMRIDSSNYSPLLPWAVGCQLVAMNMQTYDQPLILNDAMFRQNGESGYVLKPPPVLGHTSHSSKHDQTNPIKLLVRVLSGSCLPKPKGTHVGERIDPYVEISLHDTRDEGGHLKYRETKHTTEIIKSNGFCPVWNEEQGTQFVVYNPETALIHFSVKESDIAFDDDVGDAAIPISKLKSGYRSIQLFDSQNRRSGPLSFASLLVEIEFT